MFGISSSALEQSSSRNSVAARYAMGAMAGAAALLLRAVLNPFLEDRNPYHTAWLAVIFVAWYCGVGPAIVTIIISALGVWYWFLPPYSSFRIQGTPEVAGLLGFLLFSAVIVSLGEAARRSMLKRQLAEEELRKTREELEDRVKERTAELEQRTAELSEKAALLDMANDAIFVKTASGTISYWNEGAERLYGWSMKEVLGRTPFDVLRTQYPIPLREIESHNTWEGELAQITKDGRHIIVASRWTTLRDGSGNPTGWMEINTDISGRKRAEEAARKLTGRLLSLQDDERRRMARSLHDSLGQYLVALKMQLEMMPLSDEQRPIIAECVSIVDRSLNETRTISHLLHPPLLDEAGFGSAARWYVEGFGQRSGIQVNLDFPPHVARFSDEIEIALFRALQEALTNVHKHATSSAVNVRFVLDPDYARLEIQDNGPGMRTETLQHLLEGVAETGVGIAGMRERTRELGGTLEIESDARGTILKLTLPHSNSEESSQSIAEHDKDTIPAA
jgi:PAS domain S-box-containing protein